MNLHPEDFQELIRLAMRAENAKALGALVLTFIGNSLLPISTFIAGMLGLVAIDTATGIRASLAKGDKLESNKMRKVARKAWHYLMFIIAMHLAAEIWLSSMPLVWIASGWIMASELKSIAENVATTTGTKFGDVSFWEMIKGKIKF